MTEKQNPTGAGGAGTGSGAAGDTNHPLYTTTTPQTQYPPPTTTPKPVYSGSKVVGRVVGDTFEKVVTGSKHFLRRPPAIAFDVASLEQARAAGAVRVDIFDRESGCHYLTTLAHIDRAGFDLDRGFGRQRALPLAGWTRHAESEAAQLSLFGGAP